MKRRSGKPKFGVNARVELSPYGSGNWKCPHGLVGTVVKVAKPLNRNSAMYYSVKWENIKSVVNVWMHSEAELQPLEGPW